MFEPSAAAARLRGAHPKLYGAAETSRATPDINSVTGLVEAIERRLQYRYDQIRTTARAAEDALAAAVELIAVWMDDRAPVRILGAGRARLAAAIPANRLAHGGARVYLQDGITPMPHSLHGGGLIAASASGRTPSVLQALSQARERNRDIVVLGIAAHDSADFAAQCDVFIGIQPVVESAGNPLRALADSEEYVISEILDALVVAAGKRLGYTDASWRLGHEDLGFSTGPYDYLELE